MVQLKVKPSIPALLLVLVVAIGMFVAALSSGIIEEAGLFGLVWAGSCIAIIIFVVVTATSKKGVTATIIETDGLNTSETSIDIESHLKKLEEYYQKNIISKEEYKRQRAKILYKI